MQIRASQWASNHLNPLSRIRRLALGTTLEPRWTGPSTTRGARQVMLPF